jgi:hypothetical protein
MCFKTFSKTPHYWGNIWTDIIDKIRVHIFYTKSQKKFFYLLFTLGKIFKKMPLFSISTKYKTL